MKIPVDIHIRSERMGPNPIRPTCDEDHVEKDDYYVTGTMKNTKDGYLIEFTEDDGKIVTLIDIFNDTVSLNRRSVVNSHMVFSQGKAFTCICNSNFMPIEMRIRTKRLINTLTLEGGKLDIDYNVEVVGNIAERNRISFAVSPDISIIKS